ncbi:unannotated protein [freshwater metagenome]|uniref:Unannotated protein n=1 Tax=freshwater metagenome TaxID=449393 RepID=A0A6J7HJY1_9ZZZZ|nr:hypothetical protein [Actinomycetota bacterium]
MPLDPDQRTRLLAAKARALVADASNVDASELAVTPFPGGALVRAATAAWCLLDEGAIRSFGAAMVLADRQGIATLHVMAESVETSGIVARRAEQFRDAPTVWRIEGRSLVPATSAPVPTPVEPSAAARELIGMLVAAGVEVTVEHGEIRGELRGLEIARVVESSEGTRLEVGVGRHDREAFTMVHGNLPTAKALESVIASVDAVRRVDAEAHPLRRLAPEGWLRWRLLQDPHLIGAQELRPVEPPTPRDSVKDIGASIAVGRDLAGQAVVVACSVGIDLDVVPTAADARVLNDPDARVVIVVPERDDHPATRRLAERLIGPSEVIGLSGEWRDRETAS